MAATGKAADSGLVRDALAKVKTNYAPKAGVAVQVTYTGTAWPARVDPLTYWWDPTGSAPTPPAILAGEVFETAGAGIGAVVREMMSPAMSAITSDWYLQTGTPVISGGRITVQATTDKVGAAPIGGITGGRQYTLIGYPATGSTGTYQLEMRVEVPGGTDLYPYITTPLTSGVQALAVIAPTGTSQIWCYVDGNTGTAVLETMSLIERIL